MKHTLFTFILVFISFHIYPQYELLEILNQSKEQKLTNTEIKEIKKELLKQKKRDLKELETIINSYVNLPKNRQKQFNTSVFVKKEYYPYLKKYSKKLTPELFKHYKNSSSERLVLGLLNTPQYIKDSLLSFKNTQIQVRASIGDTNAENIIIKMFEKIVNTKINNDSLAKTFLNLQYHLLYINSTKTLNTYLKFMESSKVYVDYKSQNINEYSLNRSLFEILRFGYSKVYKYEIITSNLYTKRFRGANKRSKEMEIYFKEAESYLSKKYNTKIKINAPFLEKGFPFIEESHILKSE